MMVLRFKLENQAFHLRCGGVSINVASNGNCISSFFAFSCGNHQRSSKYKFGLYYYVGTITVPPAAAFTHLWLLFSFSFFFFLHISTDYNFSTSCNIVLSILQLMFWIWCWRKRWFLLLIHCTLTFHFRAAVVSRPLDDLCYWYLDFCLSTQITKRQGTAMY